MWSWHWAQASVRPSQTLAVVPTRSTHASTRYWHPLLNGYSGYTPASYVAHYLAFQGFPDPSSITALREAGVTHIVVDIAQVPDAVAALQGVEDVTLVASDTRRRIYRITPR